MRTPKATRACAPSPTETASALKKRDLTEVALAYDTSLYEGPSPHPIGTNDNLAPVTALMVDEGRLGRLQASTGSPAARRPQRDPAADAARTFADLLADQRHQGQGAPPRPEAPKRAEPLATVASPPLSALVERMLTNSDNDIAEALARQTALATGEPAELQGRRDGRPHAARASSACP